jgi:hypothetical protein
MASLTRVSADERAEARVELYASAATYFFLGISVVTHFPPDRIQTARSLYGIDAKTPNDSILCNEIVRQITSHEDLVAIDATRNEYRNEIARVLTSMRVAYTEHRVHPDLASWAVWKFFVKRQHCMHWLHGIMSMSDVSPCIPGSAVLASAMKRLRYELAIALRPIAFFMALARVTAACSKVPSAQLVHILSTDDTTGNSLQSQPEFRDAFLWQRFFPPGLRKNYVADLQNAMRPHLAETDHERVFKECEQIENKAFAQALSLTLYLSTLAAEMQRIARWHEFVNVANMEWESTNTIVVNVEAD